MEVADREIPLTQGKVAVVDAADYEFLIHWNWQAHKRSGKWYACRCTRVGTIKRQMIHMHRVILQARGRDRRRIGWRGNCRAPIGQNVE